MVSENEDFLPDLPQDERAYSSNIEDQIRLEEARRARVEAETKQKERVRKQQRAEERSRILKRVSNNKKGRKRLLAVFLIVMAALILVFTVMVPLVAHRPQTQYFATASLEEIVKTSRLSTIDCVYKGIAEKEPQHIAWLQTDSGYRVKYTARVKLSFDLSQVVFGEDEDGDSILIYLPEPGMDDPVIEDKSLGFIPEGYGGDLGEILRLCKEDARRELREDSSVREMAYENMEKTVRALVEPLAGNDYELEFRRLSEWTEVKQDEL